MSKFMPKVNTKYAKYYNYMTDKRVGYVFRDRYTSEAIENERYLINCINYIHNNPVKANIVKRCGDYKYSSYSDFINGNKINILERILKTKFDIQTFADPSPKIEFKDIDFDIDKAMELNIMEFTKTSNFLMEEILKDRIILKLLVKYLKGTGKFKYVDIMRNLSITKGQMESLKKI